MKTHDVVQFKPYPFKVGQKLHIDGGTRRGDWEVVGVTDHKVKLRCPISFKAFEWVNFCFFVEEKSVMVWPTTE